MTGRNRQDTAKQEKKGAVEPWESRGEQKEEF
ncbi:hypothetical protein CL3_04600 [butyrate-producing bacterium SM4/1]|nr:hypothetical protein CL3_04600 [butyrate-producing bacterium SM4/1]